MVLKLNGRALEEVETRKDTPVTQKEMIWRDVLLGVLAGFLLVTTILKLFDLFMRHL
jgi:hypothetical protein